MATTRFNVSPTFVLELLNRIIVVIRDFCGQITEELIRKNFVLIYEILGTHGMTQMKPLTLDTLSSPTLPTSNPSSQAKLLKLKAACSTWKSSATFPSSPRKLSHPPPPQSQSAKTRPTNFSSISTKNSTSSSMPQGTSLTPPSMDASKWKAIWLAIPPSS